MHSYVTNNSSNQKRVQSLHSQWLSKIKQSTQKLHNNVFFLLLLVFCLNSLSLSTNSQVVELFRFSAGQRKWHFSSLAVHASTNSFSLDCIFVSFQPSGTLKQCDWIVSTLIPVKCLFPAGPNCDGAGYIPLLWAQHEWPWYKVLNSQS